MIDKLILYIALVVSIITYLFWELMPKGSFYIGNALFILMLCIFIYLPDKKSFVKFALFQLSLSNFIQEVLGQNTKLTYFEISLILIVPLIWYVRNVIKL